jgi:hypothetical protein
MTDIAIMLARHGHHAVERGRAARGGRATYASRLLGRRSVVLGDDTADAPSDFELVPPAWRATVRTHVSRGLGN